MAKKRKKKSTLPKLVFWVVLGLFAGIAMDRLEIGLLVGAVVGLASAFAGGRTSRGHGSGTHTRDNNLYDPQSTSTLRDSDDYRDRDDANDDNDDQDDYDDGGWDDGGDSGDSGGGDD